MIFIPYLNELKNKVAMKVLKAIKKNGLWILGAIIILLTISYMLSILYVASGGNVLGMYGLGLKEIGDKFNNATSPIVSLSAAILFFFSFGAQYFANQKNWNRLERKDEESQYLQTLKMINSASNHDDYFGGLAKEANSISMFFNERVKLAVDNSTINDEIKGEISAGIRNLIFLKNNFTIFDIFHKECYNQALTAEHRLTLINHLYIIYNRHNLFSQILDIHSSLVKLRNERVNNNEYLFHADMKDELDGQIKYFDNLGSTINSIFNSVYQVQGFNIIDDLKK